jgi:hypothetical protein
MARDSLTALLVVAAVIGILNGLLYRALQDCDNPRWVVWVLSESHWILLWVPFFLFPYLKKRRAR